MTITYLARIRMLTPLDRLEYYMTERYLIRERRRMDEPREQWTRDPILREYKFTNVRRAWDFTSEWLTREWYTPHGTLPTAGFAAALARFLCYVPSLLAIGFPRWNSKAGITMWLRDAQRTLEKRARNGDKVFTSAYMIAGAGSAGRSKVEWVFNDILLPAWESGLLARPWTGSINSLHNELGKLNGFGDFMTQEVVLDLMETHVLLHKTQEERSLYGWAGPGAKRGLNRLANRPVRQSVQRDTAQKEMQDLHVDLIMRGNIPFTLRSVLTVHDVEFSLCEFDKYERVLWGQGTPKQYFIPRTTTDQGDLL